MDAPAQGPHNSSPATLAYAPESLHNDARPLARGLAGLAAAFALVQVARVMWAYIMSWLETGSILSFGYDGWQAAALHTLNALTFLAGATAVITGSAILKGVLHLRWPLTASFGLLTAALWAVLALGVVEILANLGRWSSIWTFVIDNLLDFTGGWLIPSTGLLALLLTGPTGRAIRSR